MWSEINGMRFPMDRETGANQSGEYVTGSIDRVDIATGEITTVYNNYQESGYADLKILFLMNSVDFFSLI